MLSEDFAYIGNFICRESIRNISCHLSEQEQKTFSNHDYYYLTVIYYMNQPTFSQLANELQLTRSAISIIFNKFSRMQLVTKEQSQEDKRTFHIRLTEKGRRIVLGDAQTYDKLTSLIESLLPEKDQLAAVESLLSLLVTLIKQDEEKRGRSI
jgi:DNA-binding MarR family transcriptional regulator